MISGSIVVMDNDKNRFNRFYFVNSDKVCFYNKRHLFSVGHEHLSISKGEK